MKNILALMLVVMMVVSLFPVAVSAAEGDTNGITLELKRDMTTNGIYLRANMAHNGQTMIIAQYRDNQLEWINVTPVDNGEGYHCDSEICTDYLPTDTFKGFLWDNLADATPALNSIGSVASDIEAPELWLDAADVATVTTVDGLVSNWADKSGNDRDVYQETAANRPVYKEGEYVHTNSSQTISFLENRKPFLMQNEYTMFIMTEIEDGVTPSGQFITEGSSLKNSPAYCYTSAMVHIRGNKETKATLPTGHWKTGKQIHVLTDTSTELTAKAYSENTASILEPLTHKSPLPVDVDIFAIGARYNYVEKESVFKAQYPANCRFREILIYDGILSEERQLEIKDYLVDKWGWETDSNVDLEAPEGLTPDAYTKVAIDPESSADKQYAYYYVPRAALNYDNEPVPLVVGLHSWSATYEDKSYSQMGSFAIDRGWAMIHPDFRGANDDPNAGASELAVDDVVRAVEFMQANANIDPTRIYLLGSSGGGHMALSVASRRPDIWAAVSAWVPISDLAEWYTFSKSKGNKYADMIVKCCGGIPGASEAVDAEYFLRSPINHLQNATHIPMDINTGIHDGHTGSVPVDHSLKAFNVLANANGNSDKMLTAEEMQYMVDNEAIPEGIVNVVVDKASEGRSYDVLFRREAGNARVTVFEGGHTAEFNAAYKFFEDKVKSN